MSLFLINQKKIYWVFCIWNKMMYLCSWVSPTRPAPEEPPRAWSQQGYLVVAVRCSKLTLFLRLCFSGKTHTFILNSPKRECIHLISTFNIFANPLLTTSFIFLPSHYYHVFYKCQFVNNCSLSFTIHNKTWHKTGGNQIHGDGLDVHLMKTQFMVVKIFWIGKMMLFWAKIMKIWRDRKKSKLRLKNQLMKREFTLGDWIFIAWMIQFRTTKRKKSFFKHFHCRGFKFHLI